MNSSIGNRINQHQSCPAKSQMALCNPLVSKIQNLAALYIILGDKYQSYSQALEKLNCEPLEVRRENLCLRFARKALRHEKYNKWFKTNSSKAEKPNSRASKVKKTSLVPVPHRTARYRDSPLPYLTKLLNLNL